MGLISTGMGRRRRLLSRVPWVAINWDGKEGEGCFLDCHGRLHYTGMFLFCCVRD